MATAPRGAYTVDRPASVVGLGEEVIWASVFWRGERRVARTRSEGIARLERVSPMIMPSVPEPGLRRKRVVP